MGDTPNNRKPPATSDETNEVVACNKGLIICSFTVDSIGDDWVPATSRVGFEQRPLRRPDDEPPPKQKKQKKKKK